MKQRFETFEEHIAAVESWLSGEHDRVASDLLKARGFEVIDAGSGARSVRPSCEPVPHKSGSGVDLRSDSVRGATRMETRSMITMALVPRDILAPGLGLRSFRPLDFKILARISHKFA